MKTIAFVILPYICLAVFVVGHLWRYRYDKLGWTTRSSQLYESRLLRIGSPLFHFGTLFAILGHAMGLLLPKKWTDGFGISQELYHVIAVVGGLATGIAVVAGMTILVYRRRTNATIFTATTRNDKLMYALLGTTIALGMWNTIGTAIGANDHFNYRESVSVWFRQIFWLQPNPDLIANAPIQFQLHAVLAFLLFALWPFTRLVHVFSAPIGYFTRPYIVYRSAGEAPGAPLGSRAPKGTWESPTGARRR